MTKENDPQDKEKKGRAPRRRADGKSPFNKFQWDSVDDQAQADLIEPVAKRKATRPSRRRDKDVGTMYVVPTEELYGSVKKKQLKQTHAEDVAEFRAEIEEGEEDPYAIPCYGGMKVSHEIEELAEELATAPREKKEKRAPKRAASKDSAKDAQKDAANDAEAEEPRAAKQEKRERKKTRESKADKPADKQQDPAKVDVKSNVKDDADALRVAPAPKKRSFLSKIQEAISTGRISPSVDETTDAEREVVEGLATAPSPKIAQKKMRWLTQNVKKVLDASDCDVNVDASPDRPQLDLLVDLLEALVKANLAQMERSGAQKSAKSNGPRRRPKTAEEIFDLPLDEEAARERVDVRKPTKQERVEKQEKSEKPERPEKKRRPEKDARVSELDAAREDEQAQDEQAQDEQAQDDVRPTKQERRERSSRKERGRAEVRENVKSSRETDVKFDEEELDPIAFWERIANEEPDDVPVPAAAKTRDRGSRADDESERDFDDWDEVGSKKKSARLRQDAQDESLLETPSHELTFESTDSTEPGEPDAKKRKPRVKKSVKTRAETSDETSDVAADVESSSAQESSAKPSRAKRAKKSSDAPADEKQESRPLEKFGELTLGKATLKALQQMGYVEPTPIQAGTIPRVQAGVDLMGQARTGTGKTAAFMIPIIEGVDECEPADGPLAMAVVPTRELAVQVRDEAQRIARYRDLNIVACYGGKPIASQVEKIRKGVDILVGTPGRIIDLTNRGALTLKHVRWVVLDEADRMLDIGFRPDVEKILRKTPSSRQTLLFSATLAPPVVRLAKTYMIEPEQFDFSQKDVSSETIEQFYLTVDKDRKFDALVRLLETQDPRQAIVFCRTKRCVDMLGRRLTAQFKQVEAIHGDLPQTKRDRIMAAFRAEKTKILVATDIVGRGIDVSTVSHIINYDIPQYCDDYVHRVGRAGRMGREGVAFTLVTAEEGSELTRIEIRINRLLERMELSGFEAYSKPVENPDEVAQTTRKPVFGQTLRRVRRAL